MGCDEGAEVGFSLLELLGAQWLLESRESPERCRLGRPQTPCGGTKHGTTVVAAILTSEGPWMGSG